MEATFILTAELGSSSFVWLDALRHRYFPPERNYLPAYLTLFHRLSSAQTCHLRGVRLPNGPVGISFEAPVLLGAGVAVPVSSPELETLRASARSAMGGDLSRQDAERWRPHVTVQNKMPREAARRLHDAVASGLERRGGSATGLLLWEYMGGPWKLINRLPFG